MKSKTKCMLSSANYIKSFPVDETTGLHTITADNSPYGKVTGEGRITAKCSHDIAVTEAGTLAAGTTVVRNKND